MKKIFVFFVLIAFTSSIAQDVQSYIELLKSDVKTGKKEIITEVMEFTDEQSEAFWPIYNEFENKLEKIADKRMANIKDFAANYDMMTDKKADGLVKNAFNFLKDRQSLNKKYYKKISKALTPTVAAKFIQVEHAIQLLLDIGIAANLPLFEEQGSE